MNCAVFAGRMERSRVPTYTRQALSTGTALTFGPATTHFSGHVAPEIGSQFAGCGSTLGQFLHETSQQMGRFQSG